MATHTIKGYITYKAPEYDDETAKVGFMDFKPSGGTSAWGVIVREHTIEVELPDDFDPTALIVADLEAEKQRLRAEFAAEVKRIDDRLQSLLAIENCVESA